jgi:hypothetical protein
VSALEFLHSLGFIVTDRGHVDFGIGETEDLYHDGYDLERLEERPNGPFLVLSRIYYGRAETVEQLARAEGWNG